jgi:FixJ family two-component response regulator
MSLPIAEHLRRHTTDDLDPHVVYIVDDDPNVREAVEDLLASCGYRTVVSGSATEYMTLAKADVPACLILDVNLPDYNGLDLQAQLAGARHPPIVFITGHGDVPSSVRAMKAGAVDFLAKPFSPQALLVAVDTALARDLHARAAAAELADLVARYATLTPRERDVLPLVVSGLLNKQAAAVLGISIVTLQIHRGNVMRKMAARSLAELVRMAGRLDILRDDRYASPAPCVRVPLAWSWMTAEPEAIHEQCRRFPHRSASQTAL